MGQLVSFPGTNYTIYDYKSLFRIATSLAGKKEPTFSELKDIKKAFLEIMKRPEAKEISTEIKIAMTKFLLEVTKAIEEVES